LYGLPTAPFGRKDGFTVSAGLMVKLTGVEVPVPHPKLVIVTGTTPGEAISVYAIVVEALVVVGVVVGV
jgi:hypothetical protein